MEKKVLSTASSKSKTSGRSKSSSSIFQDLIILISSPFDLDPKIS